MKQRVLSGIFMAVLLVPITILGGRLYMIACGIIGVLALKELLDLKKHHQEIPDGIVLISVLTLLLLIYSEFDGYAMSFGLTLKGISITIFSLFIPTLFYKEEKYTTQEAFYLSGCILFLGVVFNGLILIRNYDIYHLLYIALIPILTDIFAMLIGNLIGTHQCSPKISPKKTWEGSIAGTMIASIIATIFYCNVIKGVPIVKVILITMLFSIIGQLGDLVFSKIKRENKIKDFSNMIPGHGGILDRLDSLSFVILAFMILFGII